MSQEPSEEEYMEQSASNSSPIEISNNRFNCRIKFTRYEILANDIDYDQQQENNFFWHGGNVHHESGGNQSIERSDEQISHFSYQRSSDQGSLSQQYQERQSQFDQGYIYLPYGTVQEEPKKAGITIQQIQNIPTMTWTHQNSIMNQMQACSICMNTYGINDGLRVLNCLHRFHLQCLDQWLLKNHTCPTCRGSAIVGQ